MTNKKVFIKTFGCQMNKADSDRLEGIFREKGYSITGDKDEAGIIVYNTCSVREHAEQKAMSHLGRLKFAKRKNPDLKVCVAGCMAQRMQDEIKERLPHVDIVAGPTELYNLPQIIEKNKEGIFKNTQKDIKEYYKHFDDINSNNKEYAGYVPIMKGCNNFCAYCIVPYVRGREKYRPVDDILKECRKLAKAKISEIMLLGQTVNSHPDFKEILRKVSKIVGLERIRFVTSYPGHMDKETVDIVASRDNLCNYFHIPVQSGSNKVLEKMGRKYSVKHFENIAGYIREKIPSAAISSDFIVGFPGEKDEDFEKTLRLVEKFEFDQCFTFSYSPRPGTRASKWEDSVAEDVKSRRLSTLNEYCSRAGLKRNRMVEGKTVEVTAEDSRKGRTGTYKIVHWTGKKAKKGQKVKVKIEEGLPHSLKGKRIN
ncbi:MAG: tRNA (N6-isopentenyl adenosine(37)-C2)-methylthiotransferase MiaB [Elusimicrobiota bacterium]